MLWVDGVKTEDYAYPSILPALLNVRSEQLAAGVWPWYEACLVVDRDDGVVLQEFLDWQVKPDRIDASAQPQDLSVPATYVHELGRSPRPVDRVPVWIKELLASVGSWDLAPDSLTVDTHMMELSVPNFPSDPEVVTARAVREAERVRVEAAGGVWRDLRLTLPTEVVWTWPDMDAAQGMDGEQWRVVEKRWQAIARKCRPVKVLRSGPDRIDRLAPVVRPVVKVFAGVEIFGCPVAFLDAEVAGLALPRGSHQPLWWDRLVGLTCAVGSDSRLGPVMWFDEEQLLPTSLADPVALFDRLAEWVEEWWPQIEQAGREFVLDEANAVRPQDRRVERRAAEDHLGEQLLADFLFSFGGAK